MTLFYEGTKEKRPVPRQFSKYVCQCNPGSWRYNKERMNCVCAVCNGLADWQLFQCCDCASYFIHDFHHPAFDLVRPCCWYCIKENYDDEVCEDWPNRTLKWRPINSPNRKKTSESERTSVDFKSKVSSFTIK